MRGNASIFSLDWSPDAIIVTSIDRSIVHLNPRAESLFGYQREELIDRPLEMLLPEELAMAVGEGPRQQSVRAVTGSHRDGTRFLAAVKWRPVPESAGDYLIFSIREESAHRPAEALQAHAGLGDESEPDLVSLFAHDVRQSLQAIQFICDSLMSREPESAGTISEIIGAIGRLLERMTKVERRAHMEPVIEECSVGAVLAALHRELRPVAEHKGLTLTVEGSSDRLATDPILFRELLHNLLSNAIRYTESGSVAARCRSDEAWLRIEITDTGVGMDPLELDALLEERGGFSRDQPKLGLSIVRLLAERLGLSIEIESTPGKGSCFTVIAPRGGDGERRGDDKSSPLAGSKS